MVKIYRANDFKLNTGVDHPNGIMQYDSEVKGQSSRSQGHVTYLVKN